jgi:hypothetical protein
MEQNSAAAIENAVEDAGALQQLQSVDADTPKESVDSEPIEKSSDGNEPDVMSVLLDEDEPSGDGKSVPEGQYLKLKASNKSLKNELDMLRSQISVPAQQPSAPLQPTAEPPDPDTFEDGIYSKDYQKKFIEYQKSELARVVSEQFAQKQVELENNAYLSKYQERIDKTLPIANQKIEELKSKDSDFKLRMESPFIAKTLAELPAEALVTITECDSPESIVNYYTQKPERLMALSKNSVDELVNLGTLIGKIQGIKGTRKTKSKPITPIKAGENATKLHPIKDHDKYDHSTVAGHRKWERDMEKLNKRS